MKVFWIGFHVEGRFAFNFLMRNNYLIGAMSLDESALKKRSGVFDYKTVAKKNNIPFYEVHHVNDSTSIGIIKKHNPDLLIVLGWSQILSEEVLSIPKLGAIGAHASLLPKMRGSAPINWAIIKGLSKTGNTLIWLDSEVDTGKIIDQYEFDINLYDSCNSLYEKVAQSNALMLQRSIPLILKEGTVGQYHEKQQEEILPRRKAADGLINFELSAIEVYNFIRALTRPYPGAFFYYNERKVIIWSAGLVTSQSSSSTIGTIDFLFSFKDNNCAVLLNLTGGSVIINEISVDNEIIDGKNLHNFFKKGDKL